MEEIYLIFDAQYVYLTVGIPSDTHFIQQIFGTDSHSITNIQMPLQEEYIFSQDRLD